MIVVDLPRPPGTDENTYGYGVSHIIRDGRPIVAYPHHLDLSHPDLLDQLIEQFLKPMSQGATSD